MQINPDMNMPVNETQKQLKAARDWEAYFIGFIMKEMRKTVPKTGLFGDDSRAMEMFNEMLDQQLAQNMADNGGFGLAKSVYKTLFEQQTQEVNRDKALSLYEEGGKIS